MLANFPEDQGWNLALLGRYQQNSPRVQHPDKLMYVHIDLTSKSMQKELVEKFEMTKEIWLRKQKARQLDREVLKKDNVRRNR